MTLSVPILPISPMAMTPKFLRHLDVFQKLKTEYHFDNSLYGTQESVCAKQTLYH